MATPTTEALFATDADRVLAREASQKLGAGLSHDKRFRLHIGEGWDFDPVELPKPAVEMLLRALHEMAGGLSASVPPDRRAARLQVLTELAALDQELGFY